VVSNEIGDPYSRAVLSRYWRDVVKAAGVRHIKLYAARHTCAMRSSESVSIKCGPGVGG
jgi:integrase